MDLPQAALKHVRRKTTQPVTRHQGVDNRETLTTDIENTSRRSPETMSIPRRPLSARLRGIPAPYVRTSLSPDRVLRRRARGSGDHPAITHADIIEISSDDEADNAPTPPFSHHPAPSAFNPPEVIDLTQLPSTPPPQARPPSPSNLSDSTEPVDTFLDSESDHNDCLGTMPICTYPVPSRERPPWIRAGMGKLYLNHPDVYCEVRCDSRHPLSQFKKPRSWFIKCRECSEEKMMMIRAGPGSTIENFIRHVDLVHPHIRSVAAEGAVL